MNIYEKLICAYDSWFIMAGRNEYSNAKPNVLLLGRETWRELQKEHENSGILLERPKDEPATWRRLEIEVVDKDYHLSIGRRLVLQEGDVFVEEKRHRPKWEAAF